MILFLEDWEKWPTANPDFDTRNESFVRLSSVYRKLGIRNHVFLLALVNQNLKGIDPFDPGLSKSEMASIAVECFLNPWFYFREVVRIKPSGSNTAVMLEANRANIATYWCFFNHVMWILIQPRQTGKSVTTDGLINLLMNILCRNTQINLLTKDEVLRRRTVVRIKEAGMELPFYLQAKNNTDANNSEEITINAYLNHFQTHVPQASEKLALNKGRGLTSPILLCDEGPFQPNIRLALPAALAAGGAAFDIARENGTPYCTGLTTTAGRIDDKDGKYVFELKEESADWTEKFLDAANEQELEKLVRGSSRGRKYRINLTFNHRQLGKTDAWLASKIEEATVSGEEADRDFFNRWTFGSQSNPLPTEMLEKIRGSYMETLYTEIAKPHGYITHWFLPEHEVMERMNRSKVSLGCDTSEASGRDDISLVFTDVDTLEVLAVGIYNETNIILFAQWVCHLLVTFKGVTAIIEHRSTGSAIIDYLLLWLPQFGEDPFKRLFNWIVNDSLKHKDAYLEIQTPLVRRQRDIYDRLKSLFGFATSGSGEQSRASLYTTTLRNAVKMGGDKVRHQGTIDQITGLVNRNGRIDHPAGKHDDLVIGWLLSHWLISQGKNLSYYGIERVMTNVNIGKEESHEQILTRLEQEDIRVRMNEIYDMIADEEDDHVVMALEHELRVLNQRVIISANDIHSVDDLIRQAKESRKKRARQNVFNHVPYGSHWRDPVHFHQGIISDRPLSISDMRVHYPTRK